MPVGPILAATDLSARADRALDRALNLGDQLDRDVSVVYARKFSVQEVDREVEHLVREVLPDPNAEIDILTPVGTPPEEIGQAAKDIGAAMLCVGPARYNAIGDFFLGNAIDYIARYSDTPLLVVKKRVHGAYSRIVFATDFSDCSRRALLKAAELFPDARIDIVHAYHVPFQSWQKAPYVREEVKSWAKESLDEFMASLANVSGVADRINGAVVHGSASHAVTSQIGKDTAALAVFGTHGESGFRHATIGSVANQLLDTLPIDCLMIKAPKA